MKFQRKLRESTKKQVAAAQGWICGACGTILDSTYQVNHIIPWSICYDDSLNNLVALHPDCHAAITQDSHYWILLYNKSIENSKSSFVCLGCRKVLSKYWTHRNCDSRFTFGAFPFSACRRNIE